MKRNIKEAKRHLEIARKLAKNADSAFKGMTLEEAIKKMRKVREKLWEEKFAIHS